MRSCISELEAHENHSGPIPPPEVGGTHWAYVAYCDEEIDHDIYGYGNTEADACADYLRNVAEEMCNECPRGECNSDHDCIMFEPNLSYFIKSHVPLEYSSQGTQGTQGTQSSATHDTWLELNKEKEKDDDEIQF